MEKEKVLKPVSDYWEFLKELKSQFNSVIVLERQFFEIEELCEWSVKNEASCLNDKGDRVSINDDYLNEQQKSVYSRLHKAVRDLDIMLYAGAGCFDKKEGN